MQKTKGVVVITGSSRGIGKEVARQLLQLGYSVAINGRNEARLYATLKDLKAMSSNVIAVLSDVSDPNGADLFINQAVKEFGRIDALINNVGVSSRGNLANLHPSVIRTLFESNVYGSVYPTQWALPYLRATQGSVIFVSSLAGIRGLPGLSPYSASKMALRAFAEAVRIEEHQHGVHAGIVLVGKTAVEPDKEVIMEEGSTRLLAPRTGKGIQSIEGVAEGIINALLRRKNQVIMTPLGKLQSVLQVIAPKLVERIIIKNIHRFEEENK
jgi:dehydrogenase/reductase SDR family protein 7B